MTILRRIFPLRFIFITIGVLAYFAWIQPVVLVALRQAQQQPDWQLGLIFVAIQILNVFAILYKGPFVQERIANYAPVYRRPNQIYLDVEIFATLAAVMGYVGLVSPLANWTILSIFGIDIRGTPPFWEVLFGFLYLFAMLVLNAGVILGAVSQSMGQQIQRLPWLRLGELYPMTVEWLADVLLAAFSVTTYTLIWEYYAASILFTGQTPQSAFEDYLGAIVFFCMVYPATNILATADDWLIHRPQRLRLLSGIIFLAVMAVAIGSLTIYKR